MIQKTVGRLFQMSGIHAESTSIRKRLPTLCTSLVRLAYTAPDHL